MLKRFLKRIFGHCLHDRMTFPMNRRHHGEVYVVCLECGREFTYDWYLMRIHDLKGDPK